MVRNQRENMAAGTTLMVMLRRTILIMRGIARRLIFVIMTGMTILGHRRENLARVMRQDAQLQPE
jgi:hypothetical protein